MTEHLPARTQFRHLTPLSVRWGDMDAFGHVNNVIFVRYLESARIAYFFDVLGEFDHTEEGPIVGEVTCRYLRQVRHPADLTVGTSVIRLGNSTLVFQNAVFVDDDETPAAVGHVTIVWFDYRVQRSARVPDRVRKAITEYEIEPPAS